MPVFRRRFCVRARQATAKPIKYFGAPGRPPKQGQPRPHRVSAYRYRRVFNKVFCADFHNGAYATLTREREVRDTTISRFGLCTDRHACRTCPHRRRPKPRQGPRKAHGPTPFPHTGPTERGYQRQGARRYVAGIGRQLRPQHIHHAPCYARSLGRAISRLAE